MKTKVGILKVGDRYRVRWFGDVDIETGKQRAFTSSFVFKREAVAFACKMQAELDSGVRRRADPTVTLGQLIDEFTEARVSRLSESSKGLYANTMKQLRDYFGDALPLRSIEQRQAEAFIATRKRVEKSGAKAEKERAKQKKAEKRVDELAPWTLAHHVKHCRALFHCAVEWGYVHRNPFVPARTRGHSPLSVTARSRPWHHLTPDEFRRLLAVVPTTRPHHRAFFWLTYGAGLRPGEAINATIDAIDLDAGLVHVRNRSGSDLAPPFRVKGEHAARTSKERTVRIPSAALPDLRSAAQQAFRAGGFVALTPERYAAALEQWHLCRDGQPWGGRPWRQWQNRDLVNNLLRDAKAYLHKAGVKMTAPFTLNALRKSFAQNCADNGVTPRTLADLLGHSDTRVTMTFYQQCGDANRTAAAETLDRLLTFPVETKISQASAG